MGAISKVSICKCCLLLGGLFFISSALRAQQGLWKADIDYSVGLPMGKLKDVVDEVSARGGSVAVTYGVTDALSLGLEAGFQDFYKKYPRQIFHESGSDLSAVITNSIQIIPILVKAKYNFSTTGVLRPFAGLGIGGNLAQYQKYFGQFVESQSKVGFVARPELGVQMPIGRAKQAGVHILAGYNFMPYNDRDLDDINNVVFKLGLNLPLR